MIPVFRVLRFQKYDHNYVPLSYPVSSNVGDCTAVIQTGDPLRQTNASEWGSTCNVSLIEKTGDYRHSKVCQQDEGGLVRRVMGETE